jgi:uncharacterized repeat protein (TIGR01451 family)
MKKLLLLVGGLISLTAMSQQSQGDLFYDHFSFVNHDSSYCQSDIVVNYMITKSNSIIGDEVKFIDFQGNVFQTETNLTGDANWTINYGQVDYWMESDEYVFGGFLNSVIPNSFFYKIASGLDTIVVQEHFVNEPIPDACSYESVEGQVYLDLNEDCIFNAGDSALNQVFVDYKGFYSGNSPIINGGTWSQITGNYQDNAQQSWLDSFVVSINPLYQFIFPYSSCSQTSYTGYQLPASGFDFSLQCADFDTRVGVSHGGPIRPIIPFRLYPRVSNIGCEAASGVLKLVLDDEVTYNAANSSNPADWTDGDTLFWNYSNLTNATNGAYWNSFIGSIELTPSINVNIGDQLCFEVITDVETGDIDGANNTYQICYNVVNSYDPNIKEVMPKGQGSEGYIAANTEKLTYTIHFQNTGNAEAINVRISDTLESHILPTTLKILSSSHTMIPSWISDNIIDFNFNNINLPDSTTNEVGSHGYVTFEIDMEQGLSPATEIRNKAGIYFDSNDPIITNEALNTIELIQGIDEVAKNFEASAYPNPFKNELTLDLESDNYTIEIMNAIGQTVFSSKNNTGKTLVQTGHFEKGVYFVRMKNNNLIKTIKVVK